RRGNKPATCLPVAFVLLLRRAPVILVIHLPCHVPLGGLDVRRRQPQSRGESVMTFEEILDQVIAMLQRRGRVTYRALKRQFNLDDAFLEDLKEELLYGQQLAVDEDDKVLVWTGGADRASGLAPPAAFSPAAAPRRPPL